MVFLLHEDVMSKQMDKLALLRHAFEAGLRAVMADEFMPKLSMILASVSVVNKSIYLLLARARAMAQAYLRMVAWQRVPWLLCHTARRLGIITACLHHVKIMTAAHPVPDEKSEAAAKAAFGIC